jgi:hypothetical protein
MYKLFDSSILKRRADGVVVISNYLSDGEEVLPPHATAADWDKK